MWISLSATSQKCSVELISNHFGDNFNTKNVFLSYINQFVIGALSHWKWPQRMGSQKSDMWSTKILRLQHLNNLLSVPRFPAYAKKIFPITLHHHQLETLIQGTIAPYFDVVYRNLSAHHVKNAAEIEIHWTRQRFSKSTIVQVLSSLMICNLGFLRFLSGSSDT